MTGRVIKERQQKLSAVNAGPSADSAGINCARPVVFEEIRAFSKVPNEPTITKGMKTVNASLMELRYLFSSTHAATSMSLSSRTSEKAMTTSFLTYYQFLLTQAAVNLLSNCLQLLTKIESWLNQQIQRRPAIKH